METSNISEKHEKKLDPCPHPNPPHFGCLAILPLPLLWVRVRVRVLWRGNFFFQNEFLPFCEANVKVREGCISSPLFTNHAVLTTLVLTQFTVHQF